MFRFRWFKGLQVLGLIPALLVFALAGCGGQKQAEVKAADGKQAGGQEIIYTVADPTGDWGFPSPFARYANF